MARSYHVAKEAHGRGAVILCGTLFCILSLPAAFSSALGITQTALGSALVASVDSCKKKV